MKPKSMLVLTRAQSFADQFDDPMWLITGTLSIRRLRTSLISMFCRYVINKMNHRTNCYQGILVTLGTMKHKGQLNDFEFAEVESIFQMLNAELPTPPHVENEVFRNSVSWFKKNAPQLQSYLRQMNRAAMLLQRMGYEILLLEAGNLQDVLYEDCYQVLTRAGSNQFQILSANHHLQNLDLEITNRP